MKTNYRIHGTKPLKIAVVHGGPGATGDMKPVAKELAKSFGVLEPLQTTKSVSKQTAELANILTKHMCSPATLIGHSWGAWLSFILAAQYPNLVKKLILVSTPPLEKKYSKNIMNNRIEPLNTKDRKQLEQIVNMFANPNTKNKDLTKFKKFIAEVDSYDPQFYENNKEDFRIDIFRKVMAEANNLRDNGKLLPLGKQIKCPVIAIHGDKDPHPYEGVQLPLSTTLKNFKFILLKKCGHTPWIEKYAKDKFYTILRQEIC